MSLSVAGFRRSLPHSVSIRPEHHSSVGDKVTLTMLTCVCLVCDGIVSGGAHRASDEACGRLDHDDPGDGHGTGEMMVAGDGVVGTDTCATIVTDGYRR